MAVHQHDAGQAQRLREPLRALPRRRRAAAQRSGKLGQRSETWYSFTCGLAVMAGPCSAERVAQPVSSVAEGNL